VLTEGGGPELTLPEAAALLGTSVESVRRRIRAGQIRAFYDERGRVRIVATVTPPPGFALPEEPPLEHVMDPGIAQVWEELKLTRTSLDETLAENVDLRERLAQLYERTEEMRRELYQARSEGQVLQDELDNTREALEYTQGELAAMWRVMSTRAERFEHSLGITDGNEAFDLARGRSDMSEERLRIQAQISRVRDLSRRRRWPWPQAS
jgi:hypothetical protein